MLLCRSQRLRLCLLIGLDGAIDARHPRRQGVGQQPLEGALPGLQQGNWILGA